MTQKSDWKLAATSISRTLRGLLGVLFYQPSTIDRTITDTAHENLRTVELTKLLKAKKNLEEARKSNRELEAEIAELDRRANPESDKKAAKNGSTAKTTRI